MGIGSLIKINFTHGNGLLGFIFSPYEMIECSEKS
jgi:hypothetical protein